MPCASLAEEEGLKPDCSAEEQSLQELPPGKRHLPNRVASDYGLQCGGRVRQGNTGLGLINRRAQSPLQRFHARLLGPAWRRRGWPEVRAPPRFQVRLPGHCEWQEEKLIQFWVKERVGSAPLNTQVPLCQGRPRIRP